MFEKNTPFFWFFFFFYFTRSCRNRVESSVYRKCKLEHRSRSQQRFFLLLLSLHVQADVALQKKGVSSPQQAFLFNVILISRRRLSCLFIAMTCILFSEDFLCAIL